MLLLVDLGEALLIGRVLPRHLGYGLLLLRAPEDHGVLDLEGPLVGVLRGLQPLGDRVGVRLVLRVQLGDVGLQLAVHVCLEAGHVELDELPGGILELLELGQDVRVLSHIFGDPRCEPALVWHDHSVPRS